MEKIIGREAEFGKLADYMESGKSEFIALYGRRRGNGNGGFPQCVGAIWSQRK